MNRTRIFLLHMFLMLAASVMGQSRYQDYIIAAKAGNVDAQIQVGVAYEQGDGVAKDMAQAIYWFGKAAEQGVAQEQYNMGYYYFNGIGVQKDYAKAVYWWRKAAEQGYAEAQLNLALCYLNGYGTTKDHVQAFNWFGKAAEQGDVSAQYYLARCYYQGTGTTKNHEQATRWYKKALRQNKLTNSASEEAKRIIKTITGKDYDPNEKESSIPDWPEDMPILELVEGSVLLNDESGEGLIREGGDYSISFQVKNLSKGIVEDCKVHVTPVMPFTGIEARNPGLMSFAGGEVKTITVPLGADPTTEDGQVELSIRVHEPNGHSTKPYYMKVKTRAFEAPYIQITDYSLTSNSGKTLQKKQAFDLQLILTNTKRGQAESVHATIELPPNVQMLDGQLEQDIPVLKGGESKSLDYSLFINSNYQDATIPVHIYLSERNGRYAEDRTIHLKLNQALASTKIDVGNNQSIAATSLTPGVDHSIDQNIPQSSDNNENTFAVIIGNERYTQVAQVPYASNDARIFAEYCKKTLGLPDKNIRTYENATYGTLLSAIADIKRIAEAYKGNLSVIFYYAGHGIPNESTKDAYLLPVDADGLQTEACYSLSRLYKELGTLGANNVVVFMDACFSGSQRGEGMLASARGVALKAKSEAPQGNMVVFSAASGDETAYPYNEKGHGLFTYFLLKKLQETKGDCTLSDLGEFLQTNVKQQSVVINRKSQTPTVSASSSLGDNWKKLKLK